MTGIQIVQIALECWGALFSAICAIIVFTGRREEQKKSPVLVNLLLITVILLVSDALAIAFRGDTSEAGFIIVRVSNFLVFAATPLITVAVAMYQHRVVESYGGVFQIRCEYVIMFCSTVYLLVVIVSQFTGLLYDFDENNLYYRSDYYWISSAMAFLLMVLEISTTLFHRKRMPAIEMWSLLTYVLLPLGTNVFQMIHYGLSLNNVAVTVSMLLIFMSYELEMNRRMMQQQKLLMEKEVALAQMAQELAEKRLQISVSQMQPHFAFNALGSIEQLCRTNPPLAASATHHFAQYLRRNLRSLSVSELVPFRTEIEHIRTYVWLEQMRFGDDVSFSADIETDSFLVPPLAVQPLVENSIKHGMMDMEEGVLHVTVSARDRGEYYEIVVQDDGCGFDPDKPVDTGVHVGLGNVRERIAMMTGGTLELQSAPGCGTTVTIRIPHD